MLRKKFFIFSVLAAGIFLFGKILPALAADIIPVNEGDLSLLGGWSCINCEQGAPAGDRYIILNTSSAALISPVVDLSAYNSQKLNFKARTYGGVSGNSPEITIKISLDNGTSWNFLTTVLATTSSMTAQPAIDLSAYGSTAQIKFETLSAISSKGAGLDDIAVVGQPFNNPPAATMVLSTSSPQLGETVIFDASGSSDSDGVVANYNWSFGDSATSNSATTTHIYSTVGDFLVTLTVIDDDGATNATSTTITVWQNLAATSTPAEIRVGDVVINEFLINPNESEKEWVEFYNNSTSTINLGGWTLSDNSSTTTLSGTMEATGTARFLVWEFNSGKLNNDGDIITLKDAAGKIIDRVAYGKWDDGNKEDNAPAPDKSYASARNINGISTGNNKNDFSETITPTKGQLNIITPKPITNPGGGGSNTTTRNTTPTPSSTPQFLAATSTSEKIIINEFLPNPAGDDEEGEWIELKNLSSEAINLSGWQLKDNTSRKYILPSSTVAAGGFLIIYRLDSQIALNNSGVEALSLYTPAEKLIDRVEYVGPAKEDYSYSRTSQGVWRWTSSLTPGQENIFSNQDDLAAEPAEEEELAGGVKKIATKTIKSSKTASASKTTTSGVLAVPLEQVRELELGQKVRVRGTVSVEPGVLGSQVFYLAGSGVQVYCYKKDFPNLKIGDYLEVTGELSESGGERRVKITGQKDIKILSSGQPLIIKELAGSDIGEETEGYLAQVSGEVIEVKGSNIYLDDGSEEVTIYIKSSTGINLKSLQIVPGEHLTVTGVVSQTKSGYRLLPRYESDIVRGAVEGVSETIDSSQSSISGREKYFLAIIAFLSVAAVYLLWQIKKLKSLTKPV